MALTKWQTVQTVAKKELRDHLRDTRTATMIFLLSIAMGPVFLYGLTYFVSSIQSKAEKREIYVEGQAHAPELVNYLLRQGMTLKDPKADYRALIKEGKHEPVLVLPKGFQEKFLTGEAKVELVYDDTRQDASGAALSTLRQAVRGFNSEVSTQRLLARGVSPTLLRAVEIDNTNMGTSSQRAVALLFLIPWVALSLCVSGCTAIAIDMTAGERERGSLEPLLMNPLARDALVLGKVLAVSIYCLAVVALTLAGFALTLAFGKLPGIGEIMSLSPAQYAGFGLTMVTFAPAMGALQMLIATYGRTFKEAQTYVTYIIMAVMMVPAISMIAQFKDALWQLFVPMLGQLMVITRILRGEPVEAVHYLLPAAINIAILVACIVVISRLLRQEKVIFGRA